MKNLIKFEELAQLLLVLCILIFVIDAEWWWYILLAIGPDISMLGYLINTKIGAISYNIFHHKSTALLFLGLAFLITDPVFPGQDFLFKIAFALYGHAAMDRFFGYGLKHFDSFQHTHLGWVGQKKQ